MKTVRAARASLAVGLALFWLTGAAVDVKKDVVHDHTLAWSQAGPLGWLDTLRQRPDAVFYVAPAPAAWIGEAALPSLIAALDSTEPAAVVCHRVSAHAVHAGVGSTVGREAAMLVDAFRRRAPYPGGCSDLAVVEPDALRRWWADRAPA